MIEQVLVDYALADLILSVWDGDLYVLHVFATLRWYQEIHHTFVPQYALHVCPRIVLHLYVLWELVD